MYALFFMYGVLTTIASVIAACAALAIAKQNSIDIEDENKFIIITSTTMVIIIATIIAMNE